jgi:hypothetical protein
LLQWIEAELDEMRRDRLTRIGRDKQRVAVGRGLGGPESAAIVFDAPGLFSTTKGCFIASWNLSASMRAMMSVPPPAFAPTRILTGRAGYAGPLPSRRVRHRHRQRHRQQRESHPA